MESKSCLRIGTDSKNKEFKLEDNGTPGMRQRGDGNKILGHRDNGSISLQGHAKVNRYVRFIDNGIFCAIGPSYANDQPLFANNLKGMLLTFCIQFMVKSLSYSRSFAALTSSSSLVIEYLPFDDYNHDCIRDP